MCQGQLILYLLCIEWSYSRQVLWSKYHLLKSMLFVFKELLYWWMYFVRRRVIKQLFTWYITMAQECKICLCLITAAIFFPFLSDDFHMLRFGLCPASQMVASSSNWVHQQHWNLFTWEGPGSPAEGWLHFWGNPF